MGLSQGINGPRTSLCGPNAPSVTRRLLTGASLTPTPGPTPTPINATTFAVTANNNYFIPKPANMTDGKGPYWGRLFDARDIPSLPVDFVVPYTTDHANGVGGVSYMLGRGSDPKTAQWLSYDDAKANHWLDSVASLPPGNPVVGADTTTNPASFTQVETAQIKYRNGKFVLTVQVNNSVGDQATVRAVADDIFHFVLPSVNNASARLLTIPPAQKLMGLEEHTGYFTSGLNPFPKLINPATGKPWVELGYSLGMRGDQAVMCQWATDDLVYGSWSFLAAMHNPAGLFSESFPEAAGKRQSWYLDPETIRRVDDSTFSAISYMTGISSGTTQVPSVIAEVFVDALGRHPVAKAKKVLGIGDATIRPRGAETVSTLLDTVNNQFVMLTQWRNAQDVNVIGMATGPLRDPALTIVEPFVPDIRLRTEERSNFRGISAVPAAISSYVGGTPVAVVGSSFAPSTAGLPGMQTKVSAGATKDSEFGLFYSAGDIPANYDLLDVFFEDVLEDSASRGSRLLFGGFATKKNVGLGAQTDALYVSNTQGQTAGMLTGATGVTGPGIMNALKSNAPTSSQSALYYGFGLDANRYLGVRGFGSGSIPN